MLPCYAEDGKKKELDLQEKWSSAILQELMDTAGGEPWKRYKAAAKVDDLPVVPGEGKKVAEARKSAKSSTKKDLPTLEEWQKIQDKLEEAKSTQAKGAKKEAASQSAPEAKGKKAKKDTPSDSAQKTPSS
jgi:small subunit ribosomal protein S25